MKAEEKAIITLAEFLNTFNNKHRREILRICYEEPKTISNLSRILKSSKKVTWQNVKRLEKIGFVELDKRKKEKSRPVYVKSNVLPEWYNNLFKAAVHDIRNSLESIEILKRIDLIKKSNDKSKEKELDRLEERLKKMPYYKSLKTK